MLLSLRLAGRAEMSEIASVPRVMKITTIALKHDAMRKNRIML
jgi:hypothetical protein